jgi:hypothetical protein
MEVTGMVEGGEWLLEGRCGMADGIASDCGKMVHGIWMENGGRGGGEHVNSCWVHGWKWMTGLRAGGWVSSE